MEASARDEPRPSEHEYPLHTAGTDQCSSPAELRKELERKLPGYQFPIVRAERARLVVSFSRVHGELEVHVRLEKSKGDVLTRRLSARDCEEARLAATFVVSVSLEGQKAEFPDMNGSSAASSGARPEGSSAPTGEVATAPKPSAQAEAANANGPAAPLLVAETATAGRPRKRAVRETSKMDSWLNFRLEMLGGPAPSPLWGGEVSLGIGSQAPGIWAPALELGIAYAAAFPTQMPAGTAGFDVGTFGLAACPSLAEVGRVRLRPCVVGHFGFLRGVGSDNFSPETSTRPWVDVGPRLDALFRLNRRLDLTLGIEGLYNFNQDKFLFDSEVFHSVSPISLGGSAGVVIHFQ